MYLVESSSSSNSDDTRILCELMGNIGCEEISATTKRRQAAAACHPSPSASVALPSLKRQRTIETKSVKFAVEINEVIPTTTPTCTTVMVVEDQWYSGQDYVDFKKNVRRDVMHMTLFAGHHDSLRHLDFSQHSVVGIEKYCSSTHEQHAVKGARAQLVQAVLDQQALQRFLGMTDPETIRMMSQLHTHTSSQRAIQRAQAFVQSS